MATENTKPERNDTSDNHKVQQSTPQGQGQQGQVGRGQHGGNGSNDDSDRQGSHKHQNALSELRAQRLAHEEGDDTKPSHKQMDAYLQRLRREDHPSGS